MPPPDGGVKGAALVTGAGRRIGARLALALAEDGYDVVVHYRSGRDEAESVAESVRELGRRSVALHAELTNADARTKLMEKALGEVDKLNVLVNNASMFQYDTFASFTGNCWSDHIGANFTAPIALCRLFSDMAKPEEGLVVNMLDFKVFSPNPDYFSYTASKMALAAITAPLAMAMAPKIRVCGIAPGLTLPSGPQSEQQFEDAQNEVPTGTGSSPDQLANALTFILNTKAYSGQVLTVDGGESLLRRTRDVAFAPK